MQINILSKHFDREEALQSAKKSLKLAYCDTRRQGLEMIIKQLESGSDCIGCNISSLDEDYPLNALCDIFHRLDDDYVPTADAEVTLDYVLLNDKSIGDRERKLFYARYKDKARGKELNKVTGLTRERNRQILTRTLQKLRKPQNAFVLRKGLTQYISDLKDTVHENEAEIKELSKQLAQVSAREKDEAMWTYIPSNSASERVEVSRVTDIGMLGFSVRLYNCLVRAGVRTVGDILDYKKEFWKIRNLGVKTFRELEVKCREIGLPFRGVYYFSERQTKGETDFADAASKRTARRSLLQLPPEGDTMSPTRGQQAAGRCLPKAAGGA